ncbi:MAG TPA: hypothetical protein VGW31_11260, partial [Hanamia sp.]|nr:hypothetical protein [Hanamia sp.]
MEPRKFYDERLNGLQALLKKMQKRKSSFAWLRLGTIVAIFFAFYLLWSAGAAYVIIASVLLVFIFIRIVYADLNNQAKIEHTYHLININEDEIKCLAGDYYDFPDGAGHIPKDHPYANDLDIFGRASLFQYINRTTSEMGSSQLAEYLKQPSEINLILERQMALKELSSKTLWLQDLQAMGRKQQITFSTKGRLNEWMKEPLSFSNFKHWKWLRYVLPLIIVSVVTFYIADWVGDGLFYFTLLVFAFIVYQLNKKIAPIHEKLSRVADELNILSESVAHTENEHFESPLLKKMQAAIKGKHGKASKQILQIKKILDRLDIGPNWPVSLPLNFLLLWNLQQVLDLEKWKARQKDSLDIWFDTLARFESLSSLAVLHFNHPEWIFPTIKEDYFSIEGTEIGHPLIPENKRVANYIDISNNSKLMLVTGSNMAGKSTYLRSIGINVVLAMAGSPVCAAAFSVSHVNVISSMRITDNLEESTSTFYAELKKLKTIIEKVNNGERVFILLD